MLLGLRILNFRGFHLVHEFWNKLKWLSLTEGCIWYVGIFLVLHHCKIIFLIPENKFLFSMNRNYNTLMALPSKQLFYNLSYNYSNIKGSWYQLTKFFFSTLILLKNFIPLMAVTNFTYKEEREGPEWTKYTVGIEDDDIAHYQNKTNYSGDTASWADLLLLLLFPLSLSRILYLLRADQCKFYQHGQFGNKTGKKR